MENKLLLVVLRIIQGPKFKAIIFLGFWVLILSCIPFILWKLNFREWGWSILFSISILFLIIIWKVPQWQVAHVGESVTPKELSTLKNELRKTLAQILGGVILIAGFYGTWKSMEISRESMESSRKQSIEELKIAREGLEAARIRASEELKIAQEGQITERFTRAVDQLGNEKLQIRLGGIYALERIARDSEKDHWPVMEILTAYVREKRPLEIRELTSIPIDVQAILTVLRRRKTKYEADKNLVIDLSRTDLSKANLNEADLGGADLSEANLNKANLIGANLRRTSLRAAELGWTSLLNANLNKANLEGANLRNAFLLGANLSEADLRRAKLSEAFMSEVDLSKANLRIADLDGVNLS